MIEDGNGNAGTKNSGNNANRYTPRPAGACPCLRFMPSLPGKAKAKGKGKGSGNTKATRAEMLCDGCGCHACFHEWRAEDGSSSSAASSYGLVSDDDYSGGSGEEDGASEGGDGSSNDTIDSPSSSEDDDEVVELPVARKRGLGLGRGGRNVKTPASRFRDKGPPTTTKPQAAAGTSAGSTTTTANTTTPSSSTLSTSTSTASSAAVVPHPPVSSVKSTPATTNPQSQSPEEIMKLIRSQRSLAGRVGGIHPRADLVGQARVALGRISSAGGGDSNNKGEKGKGVCGLGQLEDERIEISSGSGSGSGSG
ncbi:hypothetical protein DFH27DRAFT_534680, partial [Peziza echinospora]